MSEGAPGCCGSHCYKSRNTGGRGCGEQCVKVGHCLAVCGTYGQGQQHTSQKYAENKAQHYYVSC